MSEAFKDLRRYPSEFIVINSNGVHIPVTYMKTWNDGFGARGWKLDVTIGDTKIIASTRETGLKINTSVFVHDILDHFLSGFSVSGHRSEAMALRQLSKRTGSDPSPDYEQMVTEDIIEGVVNGESLISFIPKELGKRLPENINDNEIIRYLEKNLSRKRLVEIFTRHFFKLGEDGDTHAEQSWKLLGLNPEKRTEIGEAIQKSLKYIDEKVEALEIDEIKATVIINNNRIVFLTKGNKMNECISNASPVMKL